VGANRYALRHCARRERPLDLLEAPGGLHVLAARAGGIDERQFAEGLGVVITMGLRGPERFRGLDRARERHIAAFGGSLRSTGHGAAEDQQPPSGADHRVQGVLLVRWPGAWMLADPVSREHK
jgi:hypothetical protein